MGGVSSVLGSTPSAAAVTCGGARMEAAAGRAAERSNRGSGLAAGRSTETRHPHFRPRNPPERARAAVERTAAAGELPREFLARRCGVARAADELAMRCGTCHCGRSKPTAAMTSIKSVAAEPAVMMVKTVEPTKIEPDEERRRRIPERIIVEAR